MDKFETFFRKLYSDDHKTISTDHKTQLLQEADTINQMCPTQDSLNQSISVDEVNYAIKSVKTGKASSDDMINNEILKCLDSKHWTMLTNFLTLSSQTKYIHGNAA